MDRDPKFTWMELTSDTESEVDGMRLLSWVSDRREPLELVSTKLLSRLVFNHKIMGSTDVDLVKDLNDLLRKDLPNEKRDKIGRIMAKAKTGYYHDFKSPLTLPKTQLHFDLVNAGLQELDYKMQNGDYDNE